MNYLTRAVEANGKIHHVTVSHGEYATHAGLHHTLLEHVILGSAGTVDVHLLMPARTRVHFTYKIVGSKALRIQVYEGSTVTGVTQPSRSRNLIQDNAKAPITVTLNGTVTDIGVLKADVTLGAVGQTPLDGLGGADAESEFLYPENFTVRFRCTSLEADNNVIVRMNFIIEPMLDGE